MAKRIFAPDKPDSLLLSCKLNATPIRALQSLKFLALKALQIPDQCLLFCVAQRTGQLMLMLADHSFNTSRSVVVKESVAVAHTAERGRVKFLRAEIIGQSDIVGIFGSERSALMAGVAVERFKQPASRGDHRPVGS